MYMKIVVINGTEKRGVTYRLKEAFLEPFRAFAEITEYELPKDCPAFCQGCTSCFAKGEATCKDHAYVETIEKSLLESDLIVMTSPAYAMHVTGAMKALLDHLAYRWISHRPATEMFGKRAVIITQCLGGGSRTTAKDIKHSLSWWGISEIGVFSGTLYGDIVWERLSEQRRRKLLAGVAKLSRDYTKKDYTRPARTRLIVKLRFLFSRWLQKRLHRSIPETLDWCYWQEKGWLDAARPWRREK